MTRKYLPISIDISRQKILVLGGDQSAASKISILQRFGAEVEVISRKIIPEIKALGVPYKLKDYEASDLDGFLMVYSCFNNHELDKRVVSDAKARGVLVNIHDKPEFCQFISPAVHQYKNMTVAVASNGQNVHNSIKLRNHLQAYLSETIENIIEL